MDIQQILADLRNERDRIDAAIRALEGGKAGRGPGRPAGSTNYGVKKRRTMSPAARKRISEMMKLRWAERKKKAKSKAA
jgi:hypothetical protein